MDREEMNERLVPRLEGTGRFGSDEQQPVKAIPFEDRIEPRHMEAAAKALPNDILGSISQKQLAALLAQWTLVGRYESEVAGETKALGKIVDARSAGYSEGYANAKADISRGIGPHADQQRSEPSELDMKMIGQSRRMQALKLAAKINRKECRAAQIIKDATDLLAWVQGMVSMPEHIVRE